MNKPPGAQAFMFASMLIQLEAEQKRKDGGGEEDG